MGILVDFQEAKEKLLHQTKSADTIATPQLLQEAVETFAFSQLPKRERLAIILAGIFNEGNEPVFTDVPEHYLDIADKLALYIASDFMLPYKRQENNTGE